MVDAVLTTTQSTQAAERRERLLARLIEIYLTEGFLSLNLETLTHRLHCSRTTLYGIAPSKEQIINAAVRAFFRRATRRVEGRVVAEPDPVRRISVYLEAIGQELSLASPAFFDDLELFAPAREIYSQNTVIAARRVQDLVAEAQSTGAHANASFVGAVVAQVMQSIHRGDIRALTWLDDAAAYAALAELVVLGIER